MSAKACRHTHENGKRRQSPAMRGHNFCYFHLDPEGRRLRTAFARTQVILRVGEARQAAMDADLMEWELRRYL
jgi:hypothetical protein